MRDVTSAADAVQAQLTGTGMASVDERNTIWCYARQDKFWVEDMPDAASWKVYAVPRDSQTLFKRGRGRPGCCGGATGAGAGKSGDPAAFAKCC